MRSEKNKTIADEVNGGQNNLSLGEELVFFGISEEDKEDESRYYGSPYSDEVNHELHLAEKKVNIRSKKDEIVKDYERIQQKEDDSPIEVSRSFIHQKQVRPEVPFWMLKKSRSNSSFSDIRPPRPTMVQRGLAEISREEIVPINVNVVPLLEVEEDQKQESEWVGESLYLENKEEKASVSFQDTAQPIIESENTTDLRQKDLEEGGLSVIESEADSIAYTQKSAPLEQCSPVDEGWETEKIDTVEIPEMFSRKAEGSEPTILEERQVEQKNNPIGSPEWQGNQDQLTFFKGTFQRGESVFSPSKKTASLRWFHFPKFAYTYAILGGILLLGFGTLSYVMRGIDLQGSVLGVSDQGMSGALSAIDSLKKQDFSASSQQFEQASELFGSASNEISSWAGFFSDIPAPIPILSKISSGKNALKAGEHLSLAGKYMTEIIETVSTVKDSSMENLSLLSLFQKSVNLSNQARDELIVAQEALQKVRLSDIPEDKRNQFSQLKQTLPVLLAGLDVVHANAPAFTDVLGGNGPRKYLFLFQNNQEARATGGFIGSYGVLDMNDGEIRKFFINGIFDPDGQLKVDIVPPQPIRKVSAAWSLHDSNWFADFPTSAEKAIFFYEKTGGPTVDGVITITPVVLQRLLEATGSVYLPEYDVTINADNVIEKLQYKVEVDYDKEENKPKKILGDLAPILLDRIINMKDPELVAHVVEILHSSLREKHILLYSRNEALQNMYKDLGWSGELRGTSNDFLSVINSNVNGFKTDGVIEQTIRHHADIQEDGSVTDTVTVTRKHNGGDTPYEWWNAVNADYMRLYVPKGSQLISVKGQTREVVKDPLDYTALGFQYDELVNRIESTLYIDQDSGTQIFEESGKTVFGNWVYVSPKESVTIEYVYKLPFQIVRQKDQKEIPYSLLAQKQSGSLSSNFFATIAYPEQWKINWLSPSSMEMSPGSVSYEESLATDLFQGYVFDRDSN